MSKYDMKNFIREISFNVTLEIYICTEKFSIKLPTNRIPESMLISNVHIFNIIINLFYKLNYVHYCILLFLCTLFYIIISFQSTYYVS